MELSSVMKLQDISKSDLELMEFVRKGFQKHPAHIQEMDLVKVIDPLGDELELKRASSYLVALGFLGKTWDSRHGFMYGLTPMGDFPLTLPQFLEREIEHERESNRKYRMEKRTRILALILSAAAVTISVGSLFLQKG